MRNFIDTSGLERIAFVSSNESDERLRWTELAVYLRPGERRPFLAESIGKSVVPNEQEFRRQRVGKTPAEAMVLFDNSRIADAVMQQVEDWEDRQSPAVSMPAPVIQWDGQGGLIGALRWLYGPVQAEVVTDNNLVDQFAGDFGVPSRTVRHSLKQQKDGKELPSWCLAFLGALQHFDREAFHATRRR